MVDISYYKEDFMFQQLSNTKKGKVEFKGNIIEADPSHTF